MLNQTNPSIREDFAASQIDLNLLAYQKGYAIYSLSKLLPWRQFLQAALNQKELVWRDSILQNSDAV